MATQNQQQVAKIVVGQIVSNQTVSVSRAMAKAGYSLATSRNPQKLTGSHGWYEIMDNLFPDDLLVRVQLEGLRATRYIRDVGKVPDYGVRFRYLELILRLKGYLSDHVETQQAQPYNAQALAELLSEPRHEDE